MKDKPPPQCVYTVGLDLGRQTDFSAVAVDRIVWRERFEAGVVRWASHHQILHLGRWELKTPYPKIVEDVASMVNQPPLHFPRLGVDQTGVGTAVVDFFKDAHMRAVLSPVLITGGTTATLVGGDWHVAKQELVSVIDTLLSSGRIEIARLPLRQAVQRELRNFKVKVTAAGKDTFEAWRERDHDDIVLAVGIAAFLGERYGCPRGFEMSREPADPFRRQREEGSNAKRRGLFGMRARQ